MKKLISSFPEQLIEALEVIKMYTAKNHTGIRNVLVAGLGGSGIGANMVIETSGSDLKVPFNINKGYGIPAWVNQYTLFIASSFSGNTEETLGCLHQAIEQGAQVVCVTSGGEMAEIASKKNLGLVLMPRHNDIPRANLGYSMVALLSVLHGHGLISENYLREVRASAEQLKSSLEEIKAKAENLAVRLHGHLPMIYADVHMFAVAKRFQQQINENAKQLCHVNVFPEMNHNELVGWEHPKSILNQTAVVFIHSKFDHSRVKLRWELLRPVFEAQTDDIHEIFGAGETRLEEAFYLIHLFDWCSVFMAEKNGVDPVSIEKIDNLKKALSNARQ